MVMLIVTISSNVNWYISNNNECGAWVINRGRCVSTGRDVYYIFIMERSDMMLVKEAACCRMNCRGVDETNYSRIIDDNWAIAKEEETVVSNNGIDDDINN